MQFLLSLLHFLRCVMRMGSRLLFREAQMPFTGVPDRNRCRLHRDNAQQEVPGKKEFRLNKYILHTPGCRLLHNGAAKILWGGGNFVDKLYQSNDFSGTMQLTVPLFQGDITANRRGEYRHYRLFFPLFQGDITARCRI